MATGVPEPTQTPDGPAYEGRLLDRPDEDVVDQGVLPSTSSTLMTRRVPFLGVGAAGVGCRSPSAACSDNSSSSAATTSASSSDSSSSSASVGRPAGRRDPRRDRRPLPGRRHPTARTSWRSPASCAADIRSSHRREDDPVDGVPLEFSLTITDMANDDAPYEGVAVYAWHCNAEGRVLHVLRGSRGRHLAARRPGRRRRTEK
jgi:hypothetical protein